MAEKAINPKTLLRELDAIGLDAEQDKADSIYVTGLAFNFWVRVGENNHYLTFSTYAPLRGVKQEVQALRFVNELNDAWSLLQFAISEERERLIHSLVLGSGRVDREERKGCKPGDQPLGGRAKEPNRRPRSRSS